MVDAGGGKISPQPEGPVGDRIQPTALEVLERLVEATYTRERVALLAPWHTFGALAPTIHSTPYSDLRDGDNFGESSGFFVGHRAGPGIDQVLRSGRRLREGAQNVLF